MQQHEEHQYLNLLKDIMQNGEDREDRTGVGTKSIFGSKLVFDIKETIPLLTTKKMYFKGIVEELLWFLRGDTNSKILEEKGVNIWKDNTSVEFLKKRGLDYPEGEAGPCYGFAWRNFNGTYECSDGNIPAIAEAGVEYNGNIVKKKDGVDQLKEVIDLLKNDPKDRRILITAWNPCQNKKIALPPCHLLMQFFLSKNEFLDCQFYQRSADSFLGLGFDIASYATLTHIIAKVINKKPGRLIFIGGDTHIYNNHFDAVKEQLARTPYPFPKLEIRKNLDSIEDIESLKFEDFNLIDYKYHPSIKAKMAI